MGQSDPNASPAVVPSPTAKGSEGWGKLVEKYQTLVLALFGAVLFIIWTKVEGLDDKIETNHKEIVAKLSEADLRAQQTSHNIAIQARDFNDLVEKKVEALEKRIPTGNKTARQAR